MEILCHRGWWREPSEQNTLSAFERAFDAGLGVELDLRDYNGELVISHNPVTYDQALLPFSDLINLWNRYDNPKVAINVKADGLIPMIALHMNCINFNNSFFFDMSIPESLRYKNAAFPVAGRLSEHERAILPGNRYWLDAFFGDWWLEEEPEFFAGTECYLVSPELHSRDQTVAWAGALSSEFIKGICTDFVSQALKEFHGI